MQTRNHTYQKEAVFFANTRQKEGKMPKKTLNAYRFGFNGKENDNEVKGNGNQQDYGMRIYDTRLSRFLSVDPLSKNFAWYTPYQFAGNMPIAAIDLDGEEQKVMINWYDVNGKVGRTKLVTGDFNDVNALYQSLKAGLNSKTTYNLEGTKFNSNNATFSKGFEAYKEGSRGGLIKRNNGTLNFDISSTGNVGISFKNSAIDDRLLTSEAMRGASKVGGLVGDGLTYVGLGVAAFTGGGGLGVAGLGKSISLGAGILDIGADAVDGDYSAGFVKGAFIIGSQVAGNAASNAFRSELRKQVMDSGAGAVVDELQGGYESLKPKGKVEKSNELNLKIEKKK